MAAALMERLCESLKATAAPSECVFTAETKEGVCVVGEGGGHQETKDGVCNPAVHIQQHTSCCCCCIEKDSSQV